MWSWLMAVRRTSSEGCMTVDGKPAPGSGAGAETGAAEVGWAARVAAQSASRRRDVLEAITTSDAGERVTVTKWALSRCVYRMQKLWWAATGFGGQSSFVYG